MRGWAGSCDLSSNAAAIQWLRTPDALSPFRHEFRSINIFLHGRIDAIRGQVDRSPIPLTQVLIAYDRWGRAFSERLSGDFLIVIVDQHAGEVLFIRDPLGICPFYYASNEKRLCFATEPNTVHALSGVNASFAANKSMNEGFVAEWLSGNVITRSDTIFAGVQRLPPGSMLRVSAGKFSVERYWFPERALQLKSSDPVELQERFSGLLAAAVSRRSGAHETAVELSGGIDSSAVASLAKKQGLAQKAYSLVFNDPACDERQHASAVAQFAGLQLRLIEAREIRIDTLRAYVREHLTLPLHPTSAVSLPMLEAMRADGASSVLTGQGGDDLLTGSTHHPAELLSSGRWIELFRDARSGPRAPGAWAHFRRAVSLVLRARGWRKEFADCGCVSAELSRTANLQERQRLPEPPEKWDDDCRRDLFREISSGFLATSLEEQAIVYGTNELTAYHPFYDRDLYEFCLMLPEKERQKRRVGKQLMRRALKGVVPDSILTRTDKAEFSNVLETVIAQAQLEGTLEFSALRRTNWLNLGAMRSLLDDYRHQLSKADGRKSSVLNRIWTLLALELFLQEVPHLSRCKETQDAAQVRQEDLLDVRA